MGIQKVMLKSIKKTSLNIAVHTLILSGIFSLLLIIGLSYQKTGYILRSYSASPLKYTVLLFTLWFVIFFAILAADYILSYFFCVQTQKRIPNISLKNDFIKTFVIIFVLWIPYIVILYPGSMWFDCGAQINQFFGAIPFDNKNPFLQTVLCGGFIKLGMLIKDANFGIFLYVFFQMIICDAVMAYGLAVIAQNGNHCRILISGIICYGIIPVFPLYTTAMGKDTNWSCFILLMSIILIQIYRNSHEFWSHKYNALLVVIDILCISLLRNAGIGVAAVSVIAIIVLSSKTDHKKMFASLLIAFALLIVWNYGVLPLNHVRTSGSDAENLSVPLMQIARYVDEYPEDISVDDKETINKVVDYEALVNLYDPQISDSIKATYKENCSSDDRKALRSLYLRKLKEHPGCFIDAIGAKSYGYFCPNKKYSIKPYVTAGLQTPTLGTIDPSTHITLKNKFDQTRVLSCVTLFQKIPVISLLTRCGFWMWCFLFCISYSIKYFAHRSLWIYLPGLTIALGVIASPVNAYFRYQLPIMFMVPLLVLFMCNKPAAE